eukprot:TRINITY_DN5558_c0_g1_i5.p2 TRINITY_DN5558_c0_g1~~TRINITY_DN5558_c0_g1_i5.p2  ORF type:complete len:262 (-),score=70.07 TRINITY_DN5558_c0_g1_i5:40-825(-)
MARCIAGSSEVYRTSPRHSINFVTCHDGFSLRDLVSYNTKNNLANGEANRDGIDDNCSWNCGSEGPTTDPEIDRLRQRQMRNFVVALTVSRGTPMLLMGDEYGHTKGGNNNAWCQDGLLNYFDWDAAEEDRDGLARFVSLCLQFRADHTLLCAERFVNEKDIEWHGADGGAPDWSRSSRFVAFTLKDTARSEFLYVAFNARWEPADVRVPRADSCVWLRVADTALPPPHDFVPYNPPPAALTASGTYHMPDHSTVILCAAM